MKRFVVVGLGNFGSSVAETLYRQGHDVIAIDTREEAVDRIAPHVSRAAVGDARQHAVLEQVGGRDYYKEGKGIPTPLLLRRFAGHGAWDETCRATLGLTKMNWNNDSLYDRLPATLAYSDVL